MKSVFFRNFLLFLLIINLIVLLTNISSSVLYFLLFLSVLMFSIYRFQYIRKINKVKYELLGLPFFIFYLFSILLGFTRDYQSDYVWVATFVIVPVFSIYFIEEKFIQPSLIYRWIKFFSIITALFSIILFFGWEKIDFLRSILKGQEGDLNHLSNSYSDSGKRNIRAFGIFKDAYQNGIFILMGLVLIIEEFLKKKKSLLKTLFYLGFFGLAIYTTQTRNIYFLSCVIFLSYFILYLQKNRNFRFYFFIVVCLYFALMIAGIAFAGNNLEDGGSLYARFYSWQIIFQDYFINNFGSFNSWWGYSLIQHKNEISPDVNYWAIDNNIFAVFLGSGIIGLYLFIRWLTKLFSFLILHFKREHNLSVKSDLRIIIIFMTIYVLGGVMNVNIYDFLLLLPTLLLLKKYFTVRTLYANCK